jgi:hypothetical protein
VEGAAAKTVKMAGMQRTARQKHGIHKIGEMFHNHRKFLAQNPR